MKKLLVFILSMTLLLTGCSKDAPIDETPVADETFITLSDDEIKVEGKEKDSVNVANDIVYYEEGHDFTYGEGEEGDAHSKEEADLHRVVHITKPGTYTVSGTLSRGQIAVDLGKDAKSDPEAVVTLILDGVDITSTVAPAVIFYNVFECGDKNEENATKDVDTSMAGARVVLAEGSVNNVKGSYVARIYDPETVELSEDGSEVLDADKLHKYDAAFYSKRSMVIDGEGTLNITAENEGLDSELHLTLNGGNINIKSGNDGINTNEDNVSVTTINGGTLTIEVTGETGEGDGIDSNGWLVINGGTVIASACATSGDAGIDSDKGIHINGGTVIASGNMLDRIEEGGQTFAVFNFSGRQDGSPVTLKNEAGEEVLSFGTNNAYSVLVLSSPELTEGDYTLWQGDKQLQGSKTGNMGEGMRPGGIRPEGMEMPEGFDPENRPEKDREFNGDIENIPPSFEDGEFTPPDRIPPEGDLEKLERPFGDKMKEDMTLVETLSTFFRITNGGNYFRGIFILEALPE
ncbi:MAG: carbohydrate-binding domain-containing protein [Clostridia bacterium]|nr:carbohydrate-binding domain-containing protein [Clostridia bacterium]